MRSMIVSQNINPEVLTLEELILGKAQLETLNTGYIDLKVDPPDWVLLQIQAVNSELLKRTREELQRRLRTAMARRASLKTREERRKSVDEEISELEARLKV